MGLFSGMKGRKAYSLHVQGNRMSEAKRYQQAKELHRQAMALYQQAIDEGDNTPKYMMAYGVLLMRDHQFDKAHDMMLRAEKLKGMNPDEKRQLRINFAVCEWKLGRLDNAINQIKMASHDHMTSMVYGTLGYMLIERAIQTGDFTEAVEFNKEALDYDEDDAVVLDNLGQLHLAMGERAEALDYFKRAHKKKPSQVDTLFYLGKLAADAGDKETAKGYLEDALEGNYTALCTTTKLQAQELLESLA